jgi:hypothetical protein
MKKPLSAPEHAPQQPETDATSWCGALRLRQRIGDGAEGFTQAASGTQVCNNRVLVILIDDNGARYRAEAAALPAFDTQVGVNAVAHDCAVNVV